MPVEALRQCLARAGIGRDDVLLIACSGGRDSQVLLHAVAALKPPVLAAVAHVHHGLQAQADRWVDFCAAEAASLGLPFMHRRLHPPADILRQQSGLESWAREWRYRALADMAADVGARVVLTAHHANDQLETVEIRRRRGSGILGLAGMREQAPWPHAPAGHRVLRPFLGLSRQALAQWGRAHGIHWVDDPSNQDERFTRNRVRRVIDRRMADDPQRLPLELAEIGLLQRAADQMLILAQQDVRACSLHLSAPAVPAQIPFDFSTAEGPVPPTPLSRAALLRLDAARRAEALRYWLSLAGCRMPSRVKLAELERQLVLASATQAIVRHDSVWLLRYRDRIGVMPEIGSVRPVLLRWQGESFIDLPGGRLLFERGHSLLSVAAAVSLGQACFAAQSENSLAFHELFGAELMIDQGRSTDRLRLHAGAHRRSWKNLMQERGVPPSLRSALPVLRRADGQLLFAAPFGMLVPDGLGDHAENQHQQRPGGQPTQQPASDDPTRIRVHFIPHPDLAAWI